MGEINCALGLQGALRAPGTVLGEHAPAPGRPALLGLCSPPGVSKTTAGVSVQP